MWGLRKYYANSCLPGAYQYPDGARDSWQLGNLQDRQVNTKTKGKNLMFRLYPKNQTFTLDFIYRKCIISIRSYVLFLHCPPVRSLGIPDSYPWVEPGGLATLAKVQFQLHVTKQIQPISRQEIISNQEPSLFLSHIMSHQSLENKWNSNNPQHKDMLTLRLCHVAILLAFSYWVVAGYQSFGHEKCVLRLECSHAKNWKYKWLRIWDVNCTSKIWDVICNSPSGKQTWILNIAHL